MRLLTSVFEARLLDARAFTGIGAQRSLAAAYPQGHCSLPHGGHHCLRQNRKQCLGLSRFYPLGVQSIVCRLPWPKRPTCPRLPFWQLRHPRPVARLPSGPPQHPQPSSCTCSGLPRHHLPPGLRLSLGASAAVSAIAWLVVALHLGCRLGRHRASCSAHASSAVIL